MICEMNEGVTWLLLAKICKEESAKDMVGYGSSSDEDEFK